MQPCKTIAPHRTRIETERSDSSPSSDFYFYYCIYIIYLYVNVSLYLHSSDFYFYYCIFYIYINMCTCVHSLPQDSTSSTLSTTSTSIVARLPSLDFSPPHMSQSPLRAESAVFAIQ